MMAMMRGGGRAKRRRSAKDAKSLPDERPRAYKDIETAMAD